MKAWHRRVISAGNYRNIPDGTVIGCHENHKPSEDCPYKSAKPELTTKELTILRIVRQLVDKSNSAAKSSEIIKRAEEEGIPENEAKELIEKLLREGYDI